MPPLPTESFSHFQLQGVHNAFCQNVIVRLTLTTYKGSCFL